MFAKGTCWSRAVQCVASPTAVNAPSNPENDEPSFDQYGEHSAVDDEVEKEEESRPDVDETTNEESQQAQHERLSVLRGAAQMVSCRDRALVAVSGRSMFIELPFDLEELLYEAISENNLAGKKSNQFKVAWSNFVETSVLEEVKAASWEDIVERGIKNHLSLATGMGMHEISTFLSKFVGYVMCHDVDINASDAYQMAPSDTPWRMLQQLAKLCSDISKNRTAVPHLMLMATDLLVESTEPVPFLFPIYGRTHIAYLVVQKLVGQFVLAVCNGGSWANLFSTRRFSHETSKAFVRRGHCILVGCEDDVREITDLIARHFESDHVFGKLSEYITARIKKKQTLHKLDEQELYDGQCSLGPTLFSNRRVYLLEQQVGNCAIHNLLQALKVFSVDVFPTSIEGSIDNAEYNNAVLMYSVFEVCLGMVQENRMVHAYPHSAEEQEEDARVESIILPFLCEKLITVVIHGLSRVETACQTCFYLAWKLDYAAVFNHYDAQLRETVRNAAIALANETIGSKLLASCLLCS